MTELILCVIMGILIDRLCIALWKSLDKILGWLDNWLNTHGQPVKKEELEQHLWTEG